MTRNFYFDQLFVDKILTKILRMESGFEEPIRSFSRTPRKMSRDNGQFRTRTHSIASTGSNGEANGVKSVKVSFSHFGQFSAHMTLILGHHDLIKGG